MENLLLVFIKTPVPGKVKTRLAATIGDDKALFIYQKLLDYTLQISKNADYDRWLFFTEGNSESLNDVSFIQEGVDLGERMKNAFKKAFRQQFKKVIIIGSDNAEITSEIINEAFDRLNNNNVVIGPALDGGYYLLGMDSFYPFLFNKIPWSTSMVLAETKKLLLDNGLSFTELIPLRDIDTEEDLSSLPKDF